MAMTKRSGLLILGLLIVGCTAPVPVRVTEAGSNRPVEGLLVRRRTPVGLLSKITNPVGATYHPYKVAEAHRTDTHGRCTLQRIGPDDIYDVFTDSPTPLVLTLGDQRIELSPNQAADFKAWHYWTRREQGRWRTHVAQPTCEISR